MTWSRFSLSRFRTTRRADRNRAALFGRDPWYDDVTPEKFKWFLLGLLGDTNPLGYAYYAAEQLFPALEDRRVVELVRTTVLELYDEGLLVFFASEWDEAYSKTPDDVDPIPRSELVGWLEDPDRPEPEGMTIFGLETEKGWAVYEARSERVMPHYFPPTPGEGPFSYVQLRGGK